MAQRWLTKRGAKKTSRRATTCALNLQTANSLRATFTAHPVSVLLQHVHAPSVISSLACIGVFWSDRTFTAEKERQRSLKTSDGVWRPTVDNARLRRHNGRDGWRTHRHSSTRSQEQRRKLPRPIPETFWRHREVHCRQTAFHCVLCCARSSASRGTFEGADRREGLACDTRWNDRGGRLGGTMRT